MPNMRHKWAFHILEMRLGCHLPFNSHLVKETINQYFLLRVIINSYQWNKFPKMYLEGRKKVLCKVNDEKDVGLRTWTVPKVLVRNPKLDGPKAQNNRSVLVRVTCSLIICEKVDMSYFPFDTQVCYLKFGSWSYWKSLLNLSHTYPTNELEGEVSSFILRHSVKRPWRHKSF